MPRDYAPYEDELDRTVFVNGLAYESTEADIRYFFEECGDIERINLPRYQNSDRNIGYCHVRFSRRRYAKRAVRLSGKYLDKRYLKIEMAQDMRSGGRHDRRDRFDRRDRYDRYGGGHRSSGYGGYNRGGRRSRERETGGDSKTIFIKNLPYDTNEDEVGDFFEDCGEVKGVRLIYNSNHNHFKGFGYVDFNDYNASAKALKLNGTDFGGRPIYIDLEHRKPRRGYGQDWEDGKSGRRGRSNSRSGSRGRNRRSRSRSQDKLYRHTTGNNNDGDYNQANHYYDKKYSAQDDKRKSASRTSSSRSSRSPSRSRSRSRSVRSDNSPAKLVLGNTEESEKEAMGVEETKPETAPADDSKTDFNIANTLSDNAQ